MQLSRNYYIKNGKIYKKVKQDKQLDNFVKIIKKDFKINGDK